MFGSDELDHGCVPPMQGSAVRDEGENSSVQVDSSSILQQSSFSESSRIVYVIIIKSGSVKIASGLGFLFSRYGHFEFFKNA